MLQAMTPREKTSEKSLLLTVTLLQLQIKKLQNLLKKEVKVLHSGISL